MKSQQELDKLVTEAVRVSEEQKAAAAAPTSENKKNKKEARKERFANQARENFFAAELASATEALQRLEETAKKLEAQYTQAELDTSAAKSEDAKEDVLAKFLDTDSAIKEKADAVKKLQEQLGGASQRSEALIKAGADFAKVETPNPEATDLYKKLEARMHSNPNATVDLINKMSTDETISPASREVYKAFESANLPPPIPETVNLESSDLEEIIEAPVVPEISLDQQFQNQKDTKYQEAQRAGAEQARQIKELDEKFSRENQAEQVAHYMRFEESDLEGILKRESTDYAQKQKELKAAGINPDTDHDTREFQSIIAAVGEALRSKQEAKESQEQHTEPVEKVVINRDRFPTQVIDTGSDESDSSELAEGLASVDANHTESTQKSFEELGYEIQANVSELKKDADAYNAIPNSVKEGKGLPKTFAEILQMKGKSIPTKAPGKFMSFMKSIFASESKRANTYREALTLIEDTTKQEPLPEETRKFMAEQTRDAKVKVSAAANRKNVGSGGTKAGPQF